ncbi:hypothetical protein J6G99_04755 [bacterium]|nr:hypothetical protein [bacterium]
MKRWYELSPDVCIVISKIELAHGNDRVRYAKQIMLELRNNGYNPQPQDYINRIKNYSMKRWYDTNRTVFLAFEYLKDAEKSVQDNVVANVLSFMNKEAVA